MAGRLPKLIALTMAGLMTGCATRPLALSAPVLPQQAQVDPARFLVITVRNDPSPSIVDPGSTPRGYFAAGPYRVSATTRAMTRAIEHDYDLREVSAWPIESLRVHCVVVRLPAIATREAMIARLARDSRVESVQPLNEFTTEDAPRAPAAEAAEERPYVSLQVNLQELGVLQAQRLSKGAAVRVAVIDTGIDYQHPQLRSRIIERRDFVSDPSGEFRHDIHGTEVAGVIAAAADGGTGMVGIAPESRLLAFKACWPLKADAAAAVCNSFTLAQALQAAITAHADVVNLSLAGPPDPLLSRLIRYGMRQGIIYVGAVAPRGSDSRRDFPASVPGVLPVQSAEDADGDPRQLLAPGHDILTLVPGGHYDFASGSSMATAEVTGVVALLLGKHHRLTGEETSALLQRTSRRLETPDGELISVDACAALAGCAAPGTRLRRETVDTIVLRRGFGS